MPIPLSCSCGRSFNLKDELAGRKVRCPECRTVLAVPNPEPEVDPDDLVLEVLPADEPNSLAPRRAAIRAEPPEARPSRPRPRLEEDEIPSVRRRSDDDPPVRRRRPKLRRESARGPSVTFESGWFGSFNGGVIGGLLMILIAGVWFILGLGFGRIFFYPIFLVIAGVVSIVRGISGNS